MIELITHNSLLAALLVLTTLSLVGAALLRFAEKRFPIDENAVADQINAILPQTQCGKCGYPGCLPYAKAIANGTAAINQCPPGGAAGIAELAKLLGAEPLPLNKLHGEEAPPTVAFIDEAKCIGCTKCIQACPVDAILGAAKLMHTVIVSECTGCDLCVDPCPVDCIEMIPIKLTPLSRGQELSASGLGPQTIATDSKRAAHFKQRFENRNTRLAAQQAEKEASRQARTETAKTRSITEKTAEKTAEETVKETAQETAKQTKLKPSDKKSADDHAALIQAAIARVKAKKAAAASNSQTEKPADFDADKD